MSLGKQGAYAMARGLFVIAVVGCWLLMLPAPGLAQGKPGGGGGRSSTGYDVSLPQCGGSLPTNVEFGIAGVNAGIVYSANPCLADELAWAEQYEPTAILYANTADPGPALSSYWPVGQESPYYCDPLDLDSTFCSFDYGWNAAADSYQDAVDAYVSLGRLSAGATQTPEPNEWWLDLESANSWETNTDNNVAALQGAVAYLQSRGVTSIGFYASSNAWQAITGNTSVFGTLPSWRAGTGSRHLAESRCGTAGITGGSIKYSQYSSGGYDADVRCY